MGFKVYEENDINNIALAVQRLTGMTSQFKVGDIPGIINDYLNPRDLTNVHKIKLTIKATSSSAQYGVGVGSLRLQNNITNEFYNFQTGDSITCSIPVYYGDLSSLLDNSSVGMARFKFEQSTFSFPFDITITFPNGVDLTTYNLFNVYPESGYTNNNYYMPPTLVNVSIVSGETEPGQADRYTTLYTNLQLNNWVSNQLNPHCIDVSKDNKFRYFKFVVHDNYGHNLDDASRLLMVLFSYKDSENVSHYFPYSGTWTDYADVGTTITSGRPREIFASNESTNYAQGTAYITRNSGFTGPNAVIVDFGSNLFDKNLYTHLRLSNTDSYGYEYTPILVSLLLSKEETFSVPTYILSNTALTPVFDWNATMYDSDI